MTELVEKLPAQIKVNWALHRSTLKEFKGLTDFADWLYNLATNVCTALPSFSPHEQNQRYYKKECANVHEASSSSVGCKICQGKCKNVSICPEFQKLPVQRMWDNVKSLKLCKLCLKKHPFPCKFPVKCNKNNCQRKHHPFLHTEINEQNITNRNDVSSNTNMPSTSADISHISLTQIYSPDIRFRIIPIFLKNGEKEVKTYAFLDEGSSVTLLNKEISKKLELEGHPQELCLKWTGDQKRLENNSEKVLLTIAGNFEGAKQFHYRTARTVDALCLPKQSLNAKKLKENFNYLKCLPFESYQNAIPQILIGLDNWDLALPLRVREGQEGEPIAAKCRLGWTVFGVRSESSFSENNNNFTYHICECNHKDQISNQQLFDEVKKFFLIESLGVQNIKPALSKEMERARYIQETTLNQVGDQYKIGLLWKYNKIKLPDSKHMALIRLACVERRIKYDPLLGTRMNEQLQDFIKKKYIRKLTKKELSENHEKTWYLPIFPVFNPNKPGKLRIVWDAAASVQGVSLNSMLLKGDDQLVSLLGVLIRFRERKVGFSADIKEMFLRVGVIEEDQHSQRFLWRNGDAENPLDIYVMQVMTFGATCSPSNDQYVKNLNASKFILDYPRAVKCIHNNHYVDDLLDSADTEDEAIEIAQQVVKIHNKGNFEIRNFRSNSTKFTHVMNFNDQYKNNVNLNVGNESTLEKVLGMFWHLKSDSFVFSLRYNKGSKDILEGKRKPTKREVLRILMSFFDPLGLLANFVVFLKILLQEIWRNSDLLWDQPISDEHYKKWERWRKYLPKIEKVAIPRCYLKNLQNWNNANCQLHIFVDASEHASAAVAYLRIKKEKIIECTLIGAKTHVAPLKLQTIPRLELDGAIMGARFAKNLVQHFSILIKDIFYWTDSQIVLNWLKTDNPRKLSKFVAYRVAEIQENSMISNWKYVPSKLNVADEATKWTDKPDLDSSNRWNKGPEFLYEDEEFWLFTNYLNPNNVQEIQSLNLHEIDEPVIKMERFSNFNRLLRTMAYVQMFINLVHKKKNTGILTSEELSDAETKLIQLTQKQFYKDEIKQHKTKKVNNLEPVMSKSSCIYKLSSYLDNNGLLRIRGRLDKANCLGFEFKRPIILPRESYFYFTKLIVQKYHSNFQHRNHETVINEIRQRYYIPKLRRVLNKIRKDCQMCNVKFAKPEEPEMSPLPDCRLATYTPPFTYTGVDYFGPITVSIGRRTEKRWGALFTCLTIRAVHLEVAYKLDADSCIICFKNFMSRRGKPRHIYCDHGTNFVATERILREELKNIDYSLIANSFVDPEITFHFNTPLSPHMGGAWERLVKSVKISLYDALPTRTPNDQLLYSCLLIAENIVNSRPLTYLPLESEESEALTPNHFLLGSSNGDKPLGHLSDDATVLKFNYLYREQFGNKYWKRFISEYIPNLLLRPKWHKQINPIKEGDIVIICDKNIPRCNWPKGKVIEVKRASDGQIRKAVVQTKNGIFERPVVKLAVIPVASIKEK